MEETNWETYGTGKYEKCADCMVHCGYEPTAVTETLKHPIKALRVALMGVNTNKPMLPEISLVDQRPAEYSFDAVVSEALNRSSSDSKMLSDNRSDAV